MFTVGKYASYVLIALFLLSFLGLFSFGMSFRGNFLHLGMILQIWFNYKVNKISHGAKSTPDYGVLDYVESSEIQIPNSLRIVGWITNVILTITLISFLSIMFLYFPTNGISFREILLIIIVILIILTVSYNHRFMYPETNLDID